MTKISNKTDKRFWEADSARGGSEAAKKETQELSTFRDTGELSRGS